MITEEPLMFAGFGAILGGACLVAVSFIVSKRDKKKQSIAARDVALKHQKAEETSARIRIQSERRAAYDGLRKKREDALVLLRFAPDAQPDKAQIRAAWIKIMRVTHPDATGNNDGSNLMSGVTAARDFLLAAKNIPE